MGKRAVFLDRDGTIIEDRDYLSSTEGVILIPGAAEAIRTLSQRGYYIVMVSNQSGVARGLFSEDAVWHTNRRVLELLEQKGARIDAVYYCPHYVHGSVAQYAVECNCRKPLPGMGLRAAAEHDIDLEQSYMIGDKQADVEFARNCGMRTAFLVSTGHGAGVALEGQFGRHARDILHAADMILEETK